ncbi:MAG: NAD(P)H-dependent oxidoreductase subunit E [Hymenobacteraceae bacterium]|nr:NAD(P)H-dependent oxidoreductase subunit E [Hymenobacteraceae bacterium]MDX5395843.1 NAD(P)H-dependent oxidoreductase subunit E [Hymenobacteraceae bacterium]MDX5442646.1 NAD(P)H-dependent oxidoreductase subunit E [Hymenobacteraceae bacterium]MDX5511898.1 NAD(P)H-dependent oxidoreductase subunit E [Hymenobacteraceae bacterium]
MIEIKDKADVKFSEQAMTEIQRIMSHYPAERKKSALLPVLHVAQAEFGGWVSPAVMDKVAEILEIQPIEVYEVATFYTMFNLKPVGKHVLEVCRTGPCCLRGADQIIDMIKNKLNIAEGETSADGMFTLKPVECLAACGTGPVIQVRETYYENIDSEEALDKFLNDLRNS